MRLQRFGRQGGAFDQPDRGKLGGIANEHNAAIFTAINVFDKIFQYALPGKGNPLVGYHGGFIDNEKGVGVLIFRQHKIHVGGGGDFLPVDFFMNGECTLPGIGSDYLGGTARGCEQDGTHTDERKYFHQRADEGGFSGTGVTL